MTAFTILLGGDIKVTERLKSQVAGTTVIAADSGIRHAQHLGLAPILWMGDFDSSSRQLLRAYQNVERVVFPCDKDMTDGELAVTEALQRGADRLVLCGAFGGDRTDHIFLHMSMATTLAAKGIPCLLTSGHEEGWPLSAGEHKFDLAEGTDFSIVAFSPVDGLSVHGAKWQLDEAHLDFGSSLTLSNKICGTLAISLQYGCAILLARP